MSKHQLIDADDEEIMRIIEYEIVYLLYFGWQLFPFFYKIVLQKCIYPLHYNVFNNCY